MQLLMLKSWVLPLLALLAIAGAVLPAAAFRAVAAAPLDAKAQLQGEYLDRTTTVALDAAPSQRGGSKLDSKALAHRAAPGLTSLDFSPRATEDLGASSIALRGANTCNCCKNSNEPEVCCDPGINCCRDCPPMVAERAARLLALAKKSPRKENPVSSVNARDDTSMATEARDKKAAHGPTARDLDGKAAGAQAQARSTEEEEAPLQQRGELDNTGM